ncbi:MAG TPA: hypothetical protein VFQ27_04985 [Xanthobacteraceae bacterium]|nr:hypothetical protein [Xanthobacteraceae bacterium]
MPRSATRREKEGAALRAVRVLRVLAGLALGLGLAAAQAQAPSEPAAPKAPAENGAGASAQKPGAEGTPAGGPAQGVCDAACVRRMADVAAQACVPIIEAKAPIDFDWLSRPFGGMFTQAEQPGADGIIRYRGDAIRVLTPQNQWLRHAYECAFDPRTRRIVSVQLRPGRLVPPEPVAALAGPRAGAAANGAGEAHRKPHAEHKRASRVTAKRRPRIGEPSPIAIQQARGLQRSPDGLVRVRQASQRY